MKISVIYYSMTGSVYHLAQAVAEGARQAGAEVRLRRVPDLLPLEVIESNENIKQALEAQKDVPVAVLEDLTWADGIAFGSPTRYGNMAAQLKNFLDQTGPLWAQGQLAGKAAGFFTGAATMHGGHESTILTMSTFAYHHGMVIVPTGYLSPAVHGTQTGGSPYGPTELGNKPELSDDERSVGLLLGERLAMVAGKLIS
ncbi:NAD(P)H:quinone oxidoreductase [Sulfobacillus sp. hq2]|uniref:NAD(P)H:quinone oxidoreductase, type IV n=1 Tax=Sulfobacillus thermotolerans TaxID=338644 RepID=A0ABM6RQ84_9FIRM|nr:NAD(P)H:quinone oxidoreductase [Sulfobacillus sp. hq2]AUW93552.1 NAD(P)H:quinone oxidoreductase, type IV [Sulfobacillus thermotolerans]MCY0909581.1 NAD(P)H:quinone oxidoreductase [Sulfobacillus thermotolerans]POB10797.1 flavoprotein [Sulfobacillus sp. hq2]